MTFYFYNSEDDFHYSSIANSPDSPRIGLLTSTPEFIDVEFNDVDSEKPPEKKRKKQKRKQVVQEEQESVKEAHQFHCPDCRRTFKYKHRLDYHMDKQVCKRNRREVVMEAEDLTPQPHEMIGDAFNGCLAELRKLRVQGASDRRAR